MIKHSELRTGNYVRTQYLSKVVGIMHKYGSDEYDIYTKRVGTLLIYKFSENEIMPITITPEILDKCGFVGRFIEITDTPFYFHCNDDSEVYLWCEMQGAKPYKHINVNSVHQLQNLYFALCGEELNIQL